MALKILPDLPISVIREKFAYDPLTGVITWRTNGYHNVVRAGDVAGCLSVHGYIVIATRVSGTLHRLFAHRIAWAMAHGEWPILQIDHIDGDPTNNAIANLREVSVSVNQQNRKKAQRNNHSCGLLGVTPTSSGKWRSWIRLNKKTFHLGVFLTPELAHQAYLVAKRRLHEGNTL